MLANLVSARRIAYYSPLFLAFFLLLASQVPAMLLDFEVQRTSRRCTATDLPLEPGDICYSMLKLQGADVVRRDFSSAAWTEPPPEAFAWWRTQIPEHTAKKVKLAPNDVLLELFDQLADDPAHNDLRYVLTLLLVRRRVFRLETAGDVHRGINESDAIEQPADALSVYCPKREATFCVPVAMPGDARIDEIQQQLSDLLIAGAE